MQYNVLHQADLFYFYQWARWRIMLLHAARELEEIIYRHVMQ